MTRKRNQPSGSGRLVGTKRVSRPCEPQPTPHSSTPQTTSQPTTSQYLPQPYATSTSQSTSQLPFLSQNSATQSSNLGAGTSNIRHREKHGRGPAKAIPNWGEDGFQILVEFSDTFHPVGRNGNKLVTQLGVLTRNSEQVPLTYADWSEMPNDILERIWNDVKDNIVDCPIEFKSVCLAKCGKMWRDYKSRIKHEEFLPRKNNQNIYEDRPIRVPSSQWKLLVDYWFTEEAQKISEQNANNRRQRGPSCHTGRKHLQELAYQLAVKDKPNDRMSLYIASHDKDHPEVAAHIVEFDRLLDEIPEEDRTVEQRDRIFLEVFGPDEHGYCRSVGSSIHPSAVYSNISLSSQEMVTTAVNKITKKYHQIFEKEHHEFHQKLEEEYREFRRKLDAEHSEHLQKLKEERCELQQKFEEKFEDYRQDLMKKIEQDLGEISTRLTLKYL